MAFRQTWPLSLAKIFVIGMAITVVMALAASAGPLPGDVNDDYDVNLADAILSLQVAAGFTPAGIGAGGDADGDGRIGVADAVYILQVTAARRVSIPFNLFTAGDSISEAEAAADDIDTPHHESVWSTGYATMYPEGGLSLNERFAARYPAIFQANSSMLDTVFNKAKSGAEMADFLGQVVGIDSVKGVIAAAEEDTAAGKLGLLTIMLGSNDVCAPRPTGIPSDPTENMTPKQDFEDAFILGLEALRASDATRNAHINVVGIPAIYWLWEAKRRDLLCSLLIWPFVPCQNLLYRPANDCGANDSSQDPDTIRPDDGLNCVRRKNFHKSIRDDYNEILARVVALYRTNGWLPNIYYTDIFDIKFTSTDVNDSDCFHPSLNGQALLADETWCRSPWGQNDPLCQP
jgi:lysophospholipase L1-like esterase